jgi:hypothetical protein
VLTDYLRDRYLFPNWAKFSWYLRPLLLRNADPELLSDQNDRKEHEKSGHIIETYSVLCFGRDADDGPQDGEADTPDGKGKCHFVDVIANNSGGGRYPFGICGEDEDRQHSQLCPKGIRYLEVLHESRGQRRFR